MSDDHDASAPSLPAPTAEQLHAFARAVGLVRRLRDPGGCPWDREQTLSTMTPHVIEEAYEFVDAVERRDDGGVREELGDLIVVLLLCAAIAEDESRFTLVDVLEHHVQKLIERHPHVFGDASATTASAVRRQWETRKRESRGSGNISVMDARLPALPALSAARRMQAKAAAVGFDWPEVAPVIAKVEEELAELRAELKRPDAPPARRAAELGDLLFATVNLARVLEIDPETALRGATGRFMQRFRFIEEALQRRGQRVEEATLAEMDALWDEAKRQEQPAIDDEA